MMLNAVFIATGTVLVLWLSSRASGSIIAGWTAAVLTLLSMPRAYDYDKVLLYPLGLLVCWRYLDRPSLRNLVWLGIVVAVAGLFRYDSGVFIGCAAAVGLIILHAGDWRLLTRRLGLLVATSVCAAAPFLLWIEWHSGLADAVDQMWTYAMREGARTRIESRPAFALGDLVAIDPPPPGRVIHITWSPAVGLVARRALAERYQLHDEVPEGPAESRTWSYTLADSSPGNLRRLMNDPFGEHTRSSAPESVWQRVTRTVPLTRTRLLPGLRDRRNGSAFLYYMLTWLPVVGALMIVLQWRSSADDARMERARIAALLTFCLALNIFILRDPVSARIGGMAAPAAVLFAWIAGRLMSRWAGRLALLLLMAGAIASLSGAAEWERRLRFEESVVGRVRRIVTVMAATPPLITTLPNPYLWDLVAYLRECTVPADRVFVPAFVPELYFFAQRGFAGGVVATFGGHWSEPRFERRAVDALSSQSVPLIIFESGDMQAFATTYPALDRYVREHYVKAGETTFEGPDARSYDVFASRDRRQVRIHDRLSLPCFA